MQLDTASLTPEAVPSNLVESGRTVIPATLKLNARDDSLLGTTYAPKGIVAMASARSGWPARLMSIAFLLVGLLNIQGNRSSVYHISTGRSHHYRVVVLDQANIATAASQHSSR